MLTQSVRKFLQGTAPKTKQQNKHSKEQKKLLSMPAKNTAGCKTSHTYMKKVSFIWSLCHVLCNKFSTDKQVFQSTK